MTSTNDPAASKPPAQAVLSFEDLIEHHRATAFAQWAGVELVSADMSGAELRVAARPDLTHAFGGLHASMTMGLLENALGYAVDIQNGYSLVTHCSIDFMEPSTADSFVARGRVVRRGRRQTFAEADLYAERAGAAPLRIATARATVVPLT